MSDISHPPDIIDQCYAFVCIDWFRCGCRLASNFSFHHRMFAAVWKIAHDLVSPTLLYGFWAFEGIRFLDLINQTVASEVLVWLCIFDFHNCMLRWVTSHSSFFTAVVLEPSAALVVLENRMKAALRVVSEDKRAG